MEGTMRILMLSQFYPPIIGGGAIHVQSLSAELLSRGHEVAIVTLRHQGQAEFELDHGLRVYRISSSMSHLPWLFSDNGRQYAPPFPDPGVMLGLRRIIVREQPEIVHAHNWLVHSFLPMKAWSGAKLVVTLHNYNLVCVKTTLLYQGTNCEGPGIKKCLGCASQHYGLAKGVPTVLANEVMSRVTRGAVDKFLPVSHSVAIGNGLVGSRLPFQVIHNFIPNDIAIPQGDIGPYLTQLPDENYLLFVGALNRQKGVDVLLRAYAGLINAPPLVLIGYDSPDWATLSKDCPTNVFVFKNWPRYAVMEAWRRSMIALLPSVGPESCPTAVMEAMASGKPVIASRIGGIVDLVAEDETGLLVAPGDSLALREAMERLLANPDMRKRMGQDALYKVVDFQASTIVPSIEYVYEELLLKANLSQKTALRGDSVGATRT
jgi:glycosyltransferase involved in cell wall biosynthesis